MNRPAIHADSVSKQYALGGKVDQDQTFRELLTGVFTRPLRRLNKLQGKLEQQETFWALKGVSFEINEGEVVGIVGSNGAGKSTLLKILSRITAPTEGTVRYKGRIASLLEVGTGFHPELSGRENIYVNGAILGMTKTDIRVRFDEIVEFSGVGQFVDMPVKRYSSGMYVRLAFAVAAHLEPDIFLIDEVLAVGDAEFQARCIAKLRDVGQQGRTVIFVSHNMNAIRSLCTKAICLEEGEIGRIGHVQEVLAYYFASTNCDQAAWEAPQDDPSSGNILKAIYLENDRGEIIRKIAHDKCCLAIIRFVAPHRERIFSLAVRIIDAMNNVLFTSWDSDRLRERNAESGCEYEESCVIPSNLLVPGKYAMTVFVREISYGLVRISEEVSLEFTVSGQGYDIDEGRLGIIAPSIQWSIRKTR
jgi:lipopolysaccharide transport system ATP-binding protein